MRNITVTLTGAMPPDAINAIMKRIKELETDRANGKTVADVTAVKAVVTGQTPFKVYVFTFTSVMASGAYTCVYVKSAPNAENA